MRLLLAHNSLYFPSHGGGDKSNRLLMEALAARGHDVRVVARIAQFGETAERRFLESLAERGVCCGRRTRSRPFDAARRRGPHAHNELAHAHVPDCADRSVRSRRDHHVDG